MKSKTSVKKTKSNLPGAGPGRPKGSKNKTTALLKDAILRAAQEAGGGDEDGMMKYLTEQATDNPTAFMGLLGKVLPMQVNAEVTGDINVTHITLTALKSD